MEAAAYFDTYRRLFAPFAAPEVDELLVNGTGGLWVVAGDSTSSGPSPFAGLEPMLSWLVELARRHQVRLDPLCGSAGGSLEGHAFRWHCLLPPLSQDGPLLSIRRHRFPDLGLADFAGDPAAKAALATAAASHAHMLIAGPTGSGKTSLLAALLREYAPGERVVIVEALAELPPPSPCSVRLLERQPNLEQIGAVSLTRLVHEALRLRPDRLVVGEIRSHEAAAYLEALLSGHRGVMTTLHAADVGDALARLSLLARRGGWQAAPPGWRGVPLTVAVLERGSRPRLAAVTAVSFVPSG